jgi:uncharacterized membrane protein YhiD involved in acid resistance
MTHKTELNLNFAYKAIVVTILTSLVAAVFKFGPKMVDAVNNRTFDSYEQKVQVLQKMREEPVMTESQRDQLMLHMTDMDRHMSASEKEQLIIIRENQKRIGQDLQEIKNLLKQSR